MTRISTRRFRTGLIATIVTLLLACVSLGTASVLQGPRIQGAQLNLAASVVAPSSMRVVFDEAVAKLTAKDVKVTPAIPVVVQNDKDVVLIKFQRALDYDTSYTVSIAGVTAAAGGVSVDVSHRIRTPKFMATWLQRDPSGDRILSGTPGGTTTTLYTAARIQDYLVLDATAVLVVTLDDAGASVASIVATDGSGNIEQLTLPGGDPGRIDQLELSGTNVLYTFTSLSGGDASNGVPAFDDTFFRLDLTGTHISDPVNGLDGKPLSVDTVIPIPGTTAAMLHTRGGQVLRYDTSSTDPPTLVGQYQEMTALASDRNRLSVKDAFGWLAYDFTDGSETRLDAAPLATTGVVPFIADVIPVRDGRQIERAVIPKGDYSSFDSFIAIDDGKHSSPLFRMPDGGGSIIDYAVTSNDQYLVAEVSPGGDTLAAGDGYAVGARPRDVQVVVVDIWKGTVVGQWPGSHPRW